MKKIVFGIIVMFVGVLMLLFNLNMIDWDVYHCIMSWQALLIAIGVVLLFDRNRHNKNAGVILIAVGGTRPYADKFFR
ncbi:MAG: DUF5668 domain-containing protein [Dysgonamonadaceae bacterium]|nr:DUF5668 domain-containing protein [Dysgonamonadaceae bacterium]